jgi:hypothetical protein
VLRLGLVVLAAAGVASLAVGWSGRGGPFLLMLPVMTYVFAQGLSMPNAVAAAMEPLPQMAGMVASFLGAMQMLGASISGYAVNAFYDKTPLPMTAAIALMGVGALLAYHLLVPGNSRPGDVTRL